MLLTADPVLIHFDFSKPIELHCDALGRGIGAVLMHKFDEGHEAVWFMSRLLTDCEDRHSTTGQEALAIVWALERFQHFLSGDIFRYSLTTKPSAGFNQRPNFRTG